MELHETEQTTEMVLERMENWKEYFKKSEDKLRMVYLKKIRKRRMRWAQFLRQRRKQIIPKRQLLKQFWKAQKRLKELYNLLQR